MIKILILGGTQFIGRSLTEKLISFPTFDITLFNRQKTQSHLFPEIKKIKGDRQTNDINQIKSEKWDYIVDMSCYYPEDLKRSLSALNTPDTKYIFISTCSVYADEGPIVSLRNEDSLTLSCNANQYSDQSTSSYGNRKAACERILMDAEFSYAILRPALVYGPYDHTDRFYYWIYQTQINDPLLLPEEGLRQFSTTYVGDLVMSIIKLLMMDHFPSNVYNITTNPLTSLKSIIDHAQLLLHKSPAVINAPASYLEDHNISQWTDMPLWLNSDTFTYSSARIIDDLNIEFKTFSDTLQDTALYFQKLNWPIPAYGMSEEKRLQLINELVFKK